MSIRLHKEHGVNPTIPQCFICGEDKNELVLFGAAYKGQVPMHMIVNYEPCEKCKEKYLVDGVLLIECYLENEKRVPTGSFVVLKEEAFKRIFTIDFPENRICHIEEEAFKLLTGKVDQMPN